MKPVTRFADISTTLTGKMFHMMRTRTRHSLVYFRHTEVRRLDLILQRRSPNERVVMSRGGVGITLISGERREEKKKKC